MAQNWFKHDYNARNDDNILELRAEYGWKGYGLFYAFIETMAENEKGAIDINKIGGLSVGFSLPKEELITFIETCIEIGLFTKDEDGFIRNKRITKHVEKLKGFKEAGKKGAKKRWSNDSDRGANRGASGRGNATPNADKIRQDKNRKDKNSNSNGTPYEIDDSEKWDGDQPINYQSFVEKFNLMYDRELRVTDKKRKNIRSRLRTFTGKEILTAWLNRKDDTWLTGEGLEYLGDWKAAMRNDEKIDKYLNKDQSYGKEDSRHNETGSEHKYTQNDLAGFEN